MATPLFSNEKPLFQRPRVIALLVATYFLISVPYAWLTLFSTNQPLLDGILWVYWATLGLGHFFITFVLYFQVRNLRYFRSSAENITIYFLIPAAFLIYTGISVTFNFWGNPKALGVVAAVATLVRWFDVNHFAGQSFGVLQLTKAHSGAAFRGLQRRAERFFFLGAGALQGESMFLTGNRIDLSNRVVLVTAVFTGLCFFGALIPFAVTVARQKFSRAVLVPFGYFLAQASCTIGAAIDMRLYGPALALHYVEYHLLISQRLAGAQLDRTVWTERALSFVQRRPGWLVAGAMAFSTLMYAIYTRKMGLGEVYDASPTSLQFAYNMSNGIFFMHYFVESFVWKFRNPFYREEMRFLSAKKAPADSGETRIAS